MDNRLTCGSAYLLVCSGQPAMSGCLQLLIGLLLTACGTRLPLPSFVYSTLATPPLSAEESTPFEEYADSKGVASHVIPTLQEFQKLLANLLQLDKDRAAKKGLYLPSPSDEAGGSAVGINLTPNHHEDKSSDGGARGVPGQGQSVSSAGDSPIPSPKLSAQTVPSLDIHPVVALSIGLGLLTTCLLTGNIYPSRINRVRVWLYCRVNRSQPLVTQY